MSFLEKFLQKQKLPLLTSRLGELFLVMIYFWWAVGPWLYGKFSPLIVRTIQLAFLVLFITKAECVPDPDAQGVEMVQILFDVGILLNDLFEKMLETDGEVQYNRNQKANSCIVGCLVSLISVLFTQFALSMLPFFFPTLNFLSMLPLSVLLLIIMLGLGRFCKKIAGVKASAPAFVFFTIFFTWGVYIFVISRVVSLVVNFILNIEILMLVTGLCCIMSMDPGFVPSRSSHLDLFDQSHVGEVDAQEEESSAEHVAAVLRRARYCRQCKRHVMVFDHHCPAFGNCIGQRNHVFFIVLLLGFVISEASFAACASGTATSLNLYEYGWKTTVSRNFVVGTSLFCIIQVVWQVVFIMWHIYCACFNLKTDEWINWRNYPEFQTKLVSHAGQDVCDIQFKNPYDKGILMNLQEFLSNSKMLNFMDLFTFSWFVQIPDK